jgi:UDP:flavonoid glycosyltransferase YjiC (YdhE family)
MENTQQKRYKILCFLFPASGHNTPFYPIINELKTKHKLLDIVVYSSENYKANFENVGAVFKQIQYDEAKNMPALTDSTNKDMLTFHIMARLVRISANNAENLAKEIYTEKPDLIIYDTTLPGKYFYWAVEYYKKCYENELPPFVGFSPTFAEQANVYPNKEEMAKLVDPSQFFSFKVLWHLLVYLYVHLKLCLKLGLGFKNPFRIFAPEHLPNTKYIITPVFPDFQPRCELFEPKYKFVGTTLNESLNSSVIYRPFNDDSIVKILEEFKIKDNKINILDDQDQKLIYVSLGTVFNSKSVIFKIIFEALKTFDLEPNESKSKINSKNIKVLVALGDLCYRKFSEMITKNQCSIPDNIILVKMAPQTEILKRASLFINHSGMNSASEAIHFGGKINIFSNFCSVYKVIFFKL